MLYTGEDPKLVQARLRDKYSQSNNAYKDAINQYNKEAAEGIDIEDSAGPYQLRSVQDAYMKGQLDKGTRDYLLYDAFGKFARNTGKDIANIAAAYTGGTINNDREESLWADRNKAMAEQGVNAEVNERRSKDAYDQDYTSARLANELANKKLILPRTYEKLLIGADQIQNPLIRTAVKGSALTMLDKSVNGGKVGAGEIIGNIIATGGADLENAAKAAGKTVETYVFDELKKLGSMGLDFLKEAGPSLNVNANMGGFTMFGSDDSGSNSAKPEKGIKYDADKVAKDYGINPELITDDASRDAVYSKLRKEFPEDLKKVEQLAAMNPDEIKKYKYDTNADSWLPIFASAREAKRILNLARALGYDL